MTKVAFCFLLYDSIKHNKSWSTFFSQDVYETHNIYTHLKGVTKKTQDWVKQNKIKGNKTDWCGENLVWAWIKLLQAAIEDRDNEYFIILSGDCIPLFNYLETYKKITSSNKSRVNTDYNTGSYEDTGLIYADQWTLLTRREAELLVKLKTTEKGKKFTRETKLRLFNYCPDELYPVNWFVDVTYTYWSGIKTSPDKFTNTRMLKNKKTICESGAIFGRKFSVKAAGCLALKCGADYENIGVKY